MLKQDSDTLIEAITIELLVQAIECQIEFKYLDQVNR